MSRVVLPRMPGAFDDGAFDDIPVGGDSKNTDEISHFLIIVETIIERGKRFFYEIPLLCFFFPPQILVGPAYFIIPFDFLLLLLLVIGNLHTLWPSFLLAPAYASVQKCPLLTKLFYSSFVDYNCIRWNCCQAPHSPQS